MSLCLSLQNIGTAFGVYILCKGLLVSVCSYHQVALMVENLPANQETWIPSLGREDCQEKGMATHFSTLAWDILWTEEPGGLQSVALRRIGHSWMCERTHTTHMIIQTYAHFKKKPLKHRCFYDYTVTKVAKLRRSVILSIGKDLSYITDGSVKWCGLLGNWASLWLRQ